MSLRALIVRRLVLGLLTLVAISLILSLGLEILPGDVAEAVLGQSATPDTVAALRRQLGVDRPLHVRYLDWLADLARGELGTSLANQQPVAELISGRLANTMLLAALTALIAVPLALSLGLVAAVYRDRWIDKTLSIAGLSTISLPDFFIAYLLTVVFAVRLQVFPAVSIISPGMALADTLSALSLPVLTLSLVVGAHMMRLTRAAILNLLHSPYIEMARLKGLSPRRIIVHHALPNAISPIINVVVLNLAFLVVGVVVVEVVFVYPGLGQLLVDAVSKRDLPVVRACGLIFASVYVVLNLTADVLALLSNPRLRQPSSP